MEKTKENVLEIYERIKDYNLNKIIFRLTKDSKFTKEQAEKISIEFKKWMALCCANENNKYQITGAIDKFWHSFLIYTQDYQDFCNKLGKFIHHIPANIELVLEADKKPETLEQLANNFEIGYNSTLNDYSIVFGTPVPSRIWPINANPFGADRDPGDTSGCGSCGCEIITDRN